MTKKDIKAIIEKEKYYFYGLRALTPYNADELAEGRALSNSRIVSAEGGLYETLEELNGVSAIQIDLYGDLDSEIDEACRLIKNYVNCGIVLIGGDDIDNFSYDEKEIVITDPEVLGYVEV